MALTKLTTVLNKISTLATLITGQASTVKAAFDHDVNVVKDYINDTLVPDIEDEFETKENITTNRKLSPTGNFTGTLNGFPIVAADPGLSTIVAGHTVQLANIASQVDKSESDDTENLNTAINVTAGGNSSFILTENQDYQADSDMVSFDKGTMLGKGKLISSEFNNRYVDIYDPREFSGILTGINPGYNFENIAKFARALVTAKAGGAKVKVVFVGDSLTQAGHRIADNFWWVKHLEEKLTEQFGDYFTFYNRGVAGRSFENLTEVLVSPINAPYESDWVTSSGVKTWIDYIDDVDPDVVICAFGMNEVDADSYQSIVDARDLFKGVSTVPDVIWVTSPIRTINASAVYGETEFGTYPDNEYSNNAGIITRIAAEKYGDACIDVNRNASISYLGLDPYQYRLDRWFGQYRTLSDNLFYAPVGAITGGGADPVNMTIGVGVSISSKKLFRNVSMAFTPTGTLVGGLRIWIRRDTNSDIYTMLALSNSDITLYGYNVDTESVGALDSWSGDCRTKSVRIEVIGVSVRVYVDGAVVIEIKNNFASQFLSEIAFQSLGSTNCVLTNISINEDIYKKYIPRVSANEVFNVQYGDGGNGLNHPNTLGELELYEQPINEFIKSIGNIEVLSSIYDATIVSNGTVSLAAGATGSLSYYKVGNVVTLFFNDIGDTFGNADIIATLPTAVRPPVATRGVISRAANATQDVMTIDARSNGNVYVYNTPVSGATYSGTLTYVIA